MPSIFTADGTIEDTLAKNLIAINISIRAQVKPVMRYYRNELNQCSRHERKPVCQISSHLAKCIKIIIQKRIFYLKSK